MRFKSVKTTRYQLFAVTGVNTVSFGVWASTQAKKGLLGFAVERVDPTENERYVMPGFKVFRSVIPNPTEDTIVSTSEHPVQSFVWDDFTAKPDREYTYIFHPIKGTPKNLSRRSDPIAIRVRTEPLFSDAAHDVFFNRGVASSQAYRRRFGNAKPDNLSEEQRQAAYDWLMRDLEAAVTRFILAAEPGDTLLGCFYEFRYAPVAVELKAAIDRGVDVQLIVDAKLNGPVDANGEKSQSYPREDNLAVLAAAQIPVNRVVLRQARASDIQHNKFMVLVKDGMQPTEVWTGSTNLSLGAFAGQTNVGHWVRDVAVAERFQAYWNLLSGDPGAVAGQSSAESRKANSDLRAAVAGLTEPPSSVDSISHGVTPLFSPRSGTEILDLYATLVDSAISCSCITLAFGISKVFKSRLVDNTPLSPIVFMLLEKKDVKNPQSNTPFVRLTARNNVYEAWGSFIRDPLYQWAKETNAGVLGLNAHVVYVHSKFLLRDPLGADPIVVTGSANFSEASTNDNDENMIVVRGDTRVADIYFTEFSRLFNHYYFRSVLEALTHSGHADDDGESLFLAEQADEWLVKYAPGTLKAKRLRLYTSMVGSVTL